MTQESLLSQFEMLRPLAAAWATEQERDCVRRRAAFCRRNCRRVCDRVKEPDRVRLLRIETIPRPTQPQLRAACVAIDFLIPAKGGLTLGHEIFIQSDCWGDRSLSVHELVHVAQYERFGGILPFLRRYLFECLTVGYSAAPLEQEAIAVTARVCAE